MIHDDILDAAHRAVNNLANGQLLDGTHDRLLPDLRDWLASFAEWHHLGRHLLIEADTLLDTTARRY